MPALNPSAQKSPPQEGKMISGTREPLQSREEEQEEQVHTVTSDEGEEDVVTTATESSEEETVEDSEQRTMYPRRQRKQPQTLTYDKLGQPSFAERTISTKEIALNGYWRPW
ncbi:hypothetical protein KUCAC02_009485 [Chaenocephalus aceratus]|uniref:Uncharacterized protein n=1 Tax=Chaenocephalus aceratus TaxID=36190 RepID=A0ACB9WUB8_CHAAC|nr:hypothetical protein KUCAC02_009485 [Chaenocephalus aceratus]